MDDLENLQKALAPFKLTQSGTVQFTNPINLRSEEVSLEALESSIADIRHAYNLKVASMPQSDVQESAPSQDDAVKDEPLQD